MFIDDIESVTVVASYSLKTEPNKIVVLIILRVSGTVAPIVKRSSS